MPQFYEIRLVVNRDGESYTAHWIEPNSQESASFPLELPMKADDMEELRWYLEIYTQFTGAGDRARAKKIEAKLNTWGSALFNAIFGSDDGRDVYRNLLDATRGNDLCLLTIGATDPDILAQPWEMMRDRRGPLCLRGVTIRRQLRGQRDAVSHQLRLPLRVLLIVSRPQDIGFIDPRTSCRSRAQGAGEFARRTGDGRFLRSAHLASTGGIDLRSPHKERPLPHRPLRRTRDLSPTNRRGCAGFRG